MQKLLIVDDSPEIRKQLKWGLGKEYRILLAESVDEALKFFKQHSPRVVTLDLGLPPDIDGATEGLRCLQSMLQQAPATKIIVLSGNEDHANALAAVSSGAYDYYHKPIDLDELKIILSRAFHLASLEDENHRLQISASLDQSNGYSGIFGQCPQMQQVFAMIKKVASIDVPILILGESGTGKEVVARAIHNRGIRKDGNVVAINCGAIPENLLESELFGHEKGAFTGAQNRVQGKVEYAEGGTLFLDEIGEMAPLLQVKLLRFLQEKVIQRVGGRDDISVDTRIVAATNVDIQNSIKSGKFREDLYYRIGVITIDLPPLRDRGEDIELLANIFLRRFGQEFGQKVRGYSSAAIEWLRTYQWPGNVRELENKVKRAVVMAESPIIEPCDLGFEEKQAAAEMTESHAKQKPQNVTVFNGEFDLTGVTLKEGRRQVERVLLKHALEQAQGNILKAAEELAVSRPTFYDLLKKHGLHPGQ
ncbi:two component, sigma54 specific, transcriptional regulator, Fis family [Desulfuromusa kysingii]|uniref:Two component, sigma54 specific, transcriptional regulator, Fis family n=1 Tax=Desulfuromusa kysingii TaxID=37625 RepID=A0A1H4BBK6_9BACT|nr:PEP-CTERM-box response regulator transcription factor [Desulfuromusa kysingii]SEA45511.1 two component, sigma54 specific, transcriptional regulator, Fis family [Desulfuromusa kysingii]